MRDSLLNLFAFAILVVGNLLILKNNQDLNFLQIFLICLIFTISTIIIITPLLVSKYIGTMPLIYLVNLYFLLCYVGIFLFDKDLILEGRYTTNDYSIAINYFSLGYFSFLCGYFIFYYIFKKLNRKKFSYLDCVNNEILIIGSSTLILTIIFFYFVKINNYFHFLSQIKYPLLLFGIGLNFNYVFNNGFKNKIRSLFLIILIILPIFLELLSGSYNFPFMILFLIYVYYCILKRKINILPFFIIGVLFIFISLGKYDYRIKTWASDSWTIKNSNFKLMDKTKIFVDTYIFDKAKDLKLKNLKKRSDNYRLERRIFHSFWSLLHVTQNTPNPIPHWEGYSYKLLASKIIPRIFWKEKPSDTLGNEFGHRYNKLTKAEGALTKRDERTSWNMPVLNEFFVNFGTYGVIFGMFFIGFLMCFLTKFFNQKNSNNLEVVISIFIFLPLFFLESHLSLLFGAVIQSYIFLMIFSFCFLFFLRKIKFLKK